MKLCFRLLCRPKKKLAKKGKRRRLKRVATRRKSISCPIPTLIYIPVDLQINIILRLPVKSLLRFRCVSKLWSSIITSRDFSNQRLIISTASLAPSLLIAFEDFYGKNLLLVSLPSPNASSSSSSCRVPYKDLSLVNLKGKRVCNVAQGLICVSDGYADDMEIYNPSTRQLHTFPIFNFKVDPEGNPWHEYIFGYDPVEDQYKVFAFDGLAQRSKHKVVVLGGKEAWREAPCFGSLSCVRCTRRLYMNGAMYYGAIRRGIDSTNTSVIVSFDVRLETFNIIKVPSKVQPMGYPNMWYGNWWVKDKTLINYGGKIGVVENPRKGRFRMWVVEDAEKEEWSINTFHLPESVAGLSFKVMDTFSRGEICFLPKEMSDPFCLFYYNLDKRSIRSVIIEGLPVSKLKRVRDLSVTVSDYYENFIFLET